MKLPWPFSDGGSESEIPQGWNHVTFEKLNTSDPCHADVAILWGLGMERRAHALAKELRPTRRVVGSVGDIEDTELRRVRDKFKEVSDDE